VPAAGAEDAGRSCVRARRNQSDEQCRQDKQQPGYETPVPSTCKSDIGWHDVILLVLESSTGTSLACDR
jgi:hypothetical protein